MPRIQPQNFIDQEYRDKYAKPNRKAELVYVKELGQELTQSEYKQYVAKFYGGSNERKEPEG